MPPSCSLSSPSLDRVMCSPPPQTNGGAHMLRRGDVLIYDESAWITVCSSKTIRNHSRATRLRIPALPASQYCPVAAWRASCALNLAPPPPRSRFPVPVGGPTCGPPIYGASAARPCRDGTPKGSHCTATEGGRPPRRPCRTAHWRKKWHRAHGRARQSSDIYPGPFLPPSPRN